MSEIQSLEHHRKYVPAYHFVASTVLLANLIWAGWSLFRSFSIGGVIALLTAFALLILFFYVRVFPLGVQDRLIVLEERMRLERLLPPDGRGRIGEFTKGQLVGMRFASDAELPELAMKVLDGGVSGREDIKKLIKEWRADTLRI